MSVRDPFSLALLRRSLTFAEFSSLAEVPPETEWFVNIDNAHTRLGVEVVCAAEVTHQKNLALIARAEALFVRQERNATRYEKILTTWEQQQAQYQKYPDSLPASSRQ